MTKETFLIILLVGAMLATVGALIFGLVYMAKGGEINAKKSNKMMWRRITFQGVALLIFAVILLLSKS